MTEITSIYVAGASREIERCEGVLRHIRTYLPTSYEITLDWPASVRAHKGDPDDAAQREEIALDDVDAVLDAHILLLLLPRQPTEGMHAELGVALGNNRLVHHFGARQVGTDRITILASWQDKDGPNRTPLFVAPADHVFQSDEEALAHLHFLAIQRLKETKS